MTATLLTDEHEELRRAAGEVARARIAPRAAEIDRRDEFPADLFAELGALGYLGATCPREYGGLEADTVAVALILEELSAASGAVGSSVNAHVSLTCGFLAAHGGEELKAEYLPAMATGARLGAFCLTEPGGGSKPSWCQTTARRVADGYRLQGAKIFITNAPVADVFVVFAQVEGGAGRRPSAFVVARDTPGLAVGPADRKHGMHGSPTAPVFLDDVVVPERNLVGREGEGLRQAVRTLQRGRVFVAALSVGLARAALEIALDYARTRRVGGQLIGTFQGIQWPLADTATELEAARLLTLEAARAVDAGHDAGRAAAMAKLFAAEASIRAAGAAVEILGGYGYLAEGAVERVLRDAKMYQIGEGTSQIHRIAIARDLLGRHEG